MFRFLIKLFFDEIGEYQEPETPGQAVTAPKADTESVPSEDKSAEEGQGEDTPPEPKPKYGEFGDDPDKVWEEFNKIKPQLDQYKGKITATERNLSALRKTLDASGIQVVSDDRGNIKLIPKESQSTVKRRFTDEHKALFDEKVLTAIQYMIQDSLDEGLEGYTRKNEELTKNQRRFIAAKNDANELMVSYFPQLKVGEEGFNEAFYNRATEIWENEDAPDGIPYKQKPEGELFAALRAAKELNISTRQISEAKKAGYEQGKAEKKILAPVESTSSGRTPGSFKLVSKDEYLKMPRDKREEYDRQLIEQRK